jgi:hypothetical protein
MGMIFFFDRKKGFLVALGAQFYMRMVNFSGTSVKNVFQNWYGQKNSHRFLLLIGTGLLVFLIGIGSVSLLVWHGQAQQHSAAPANALPAATPSASSAIASSVSPFLFGSNLDLSSMQASTLDSSTFPALLQQAHVQIVRIPVYNYSSASKALLEKTAQMLRMLGIVPLIVLHGSLDPDALKIDTSLVQSMSTIFSQETVYYEFGNEDDALGASAAHYLSAWNSIIPQLASLAPQALFLGPATYHYNRDFLTSFLQQAKPKPDAISWHEYSCVSSWSKALCLSHLSDWTQDVADARAVMQKVLNNVLPIMITEWNYAANATANDGKSNDSTFLNSWTTRAIQTLAASHVFAAMQYTITNSATALIANDHLTAQGRVFQQQYDQLVTKISFEDGGTGGFGQSNTMTSIQNSTDVALDGQRSLKIMIGNSTDTDYPTLWFDGPPSVANPRIGQTIVAYVYVPSGSFSPVANIYVLDNGHHQCDACHFPGWRVWATLTPGIWTRLSYTVAPGVSMPSTGYGISFTTTSPVPINTAFYVDAFGWG